MVSDFLNLPGRKQNTEGWNRAFPPSSGHGSAPRAGRSSWTVWIMYLADSEFAPPSLRPFCWTLAGSCGYPDSPTPQHSYSIDLQILLADLVILHLAQTTASSHWNYKSLPRGLPASPFTSDVLSAGRLTLPKTMALPWYYMLWLSPSSLSLSPHTACEKKDAAWSQEHPAGPAEPRQQFCPHSPLYCSTIFTAWSPAPASPCHLQPFSLSPVPVTPCSANTQVLSPTSLPLHVGLSS